ncbi:MAG: hypothetical protein H7Y13_07145 [Sphingobacteriaceae bacterium]|nr:hypothetical protein [Sphingobacteriaceae bacterium]
MMTRFKTAVLFCTLSMGCNNGPKKKPNDKIKDAGLITQELTSLCFRRVDGLLGQDTSSIHLVFYVDKVSGDFNHIPHEKDSRKGTIAGTLKGKQVNALWTFMQEGTTDTLSVEFLLTDRGLLQKTFGIDKQTGRQKLTDTSTFTIAYQKIDCK